MKPHYQDEPREWRRFMLQFCGLGLLLAIVLRWREVLTNRHVVTLAAILVAMALAAIARPQWFRSFHGLSMKVSAWLGERMGKVVLTLLFLLVFTPLGLILRLFRHDPLALRRPADTDTYWLPVRRRNRLDRMH
jgi:hypothetical protein